VQTSRVMFSERGLKAAALSVDRLQFSDDQIEAISLLLDTEIIERASKSQNQRIKLAKLGQSAHPADVDLRTPRNLSKIIWQRLLSLNWMKQHQHLLLIGPTGIGKSFLACALAKASIEQKIVFDTCACLDYKTSLASCAHKEN
jgi:DNA replication protein DnaC